MDLFARTRPEVAADGEWVTGAEVPSLGTGRLMVRGFTCDKARDTFAAKARAAKAHERLPDKDILPSVLSRHTREVLSEVCILDAQGFLGADGAEITADRFREMVLDPGYQALIIACMEACRHVDGLSVATDIAGNSPASSSGTPNTGSKRRKTARR